jgi:ribose transport system permease protein
MNVNNVDRPNNAGRFWRTIRPYSRDPSFTGFLILVVLIVVNTILMPRFFTYNFIKLNFKTFTPLILVGMAQAIVLISGSVDLSVGASLSLCVVVASSLMNDSLGNIILVLALMVAVSIGTGAVNGAIIGAAGLPALISTYATQAVFFGIAMYVMPVPGGYVPEKFYRLYNADVLGFIPAPVAILLIGIGIWYLMSKTRTYRYIYAIGSDQRSAYASGIKVARVRFLAHVFASIFIAIASVCLLMTFASGDARSGLGYTMNSIAAVVIGGVSLSGGRGNIPGAIIGALILGLLTNVIFYANLSSLYQGFAKGMIIVLALALASVPKVREQRYTY